VVPRPRRFGGATSVPCIISIATTPTSISFQHSLLDSRFPRIIWLGTMAEVGRKHSLDGDSHTPPRKRLKLSDLPIAQAKRSTIDNLLHTFKKNGEYDTMRKALFSQFESDVSAQTCRHCHLSNC
jgi:hypothetical protein